VFYELAVRHTFRKPVILLIQKGEVIPFDVAGLRVVTLDITDPDSILTVKEQIGEQILAIHQRGDGYSGSPIEAALQIAELRRTDTPESTSLAELIETVANMREWMTAFQTDMLRTMSDIPVAIARQFEAVRRSDSAIVTQQEYEHRRTAEMQTRVADNFLSEGKLRLAENYYDRVLSVFPDDHVALIGKGKVLKRRAAAERDAQLLRKAIAVLNDCIQKHPTYERAYYNRACYLCAAGEPDDKVLADLGKAVQLFAGYRELARWDDDFSRISITPAFLAVVRDPDAGAPA
jgi:tetratricopeptide (TPR) repeat protein